MFSFLNLDSPRLSRPKRSRRLKAEPLETRRVLAGAINTCAPLAEVNLADVPSEQLVVPPFGPEIKRDSFAQKARPFKITGGGPAAEGLPLKEGTTATYSASGTATGLGKYTGEGTFTLGSLVFDETGELSGTFQGAFVFTAANGDQLAVTYGDGSSATFRGQLSADGTSIASIEFDAIFSPDPEHSSGRFKQVVGGGWRMIAKADSIAFTSNPNFSAPFDLTWSGAGTLEHAKKSK